MRTEPNYRVEQLTRLSGPVGTNSGAFLDGQLRIICGTGGGWEHVSVSRADRTPTWEEMDRVKRRFWRDDEVVMQLHVTQGKINIHDHCLHMWRPQNDSEMAAERMRWEGAGEAWPYSGPAPAPIPMPPREAV